MTLQFPFGFSIFQNCLWHCQLRVASAQQSLLNPTAGFSGSPSWPTLTDSSAWALLTALIAASQMGSLQMSLQTTSVVEQRHIWGFGSLMRLLGNSSELCQLGYLGWNWFYFSKAALPLPSWDLSVFCLPLVAPRFSSCPFLWVSGWVFSCYGKRERAHFRWDEHRKYHWAFSLALTLCFLEEVSPKADFTW